MYQECEMTPEQQKENYKNCSKDDLIEMIIEANRIINLKDILGLETKVLNIIGQNQKRINRILS